MKRTLLFILLSSLVVSVKGQGLTFDANGETEKVDFMGNFFLNAFEQMLNSEMYEYPETYSRIGKWIWDNKNNRIVSIE